MTPPNLTNKGKVLEGNSEELIKASWLVAGRFYDYAKRKEEN
jgi:hypothetical protein